MKIAFSQVYIEVDANFPFSVHFQRLLTREITALVQPSPEFVEAYGDVSEVIFRISAKHELEDNEIRGPTVFKKAKHVEFTVFLPFDVIMAHVDAPKQALFFLLKGVCDVLEKLGIDKSMVHERKTTLIDAVCYDPTMLAEPSWNEAENNTPVRKNFATFFGRMKG